MLGGLCGCASGPSGGGANVPALSTQSAACATHAECLVCKKNADLACVDVDVTGKTPFADYGGKRYYFCSDDCKAEFQKNPEKFAKGK